MKLEGHKQKLASTRMFTIRLIKYILFAGALVFFSVVLGTLGYHHFANLKWIDSFHMACMILTGMGPVVQLENNEAKIFSSIYALYSGVAFLGFTAVFFAPVIHRLLHILHMNDEE
ncbi:MAG: hypothetical protein IPO27_10100 [Bacteroidetes bacterium]|nr:hypothetical protein [Bacteroidota bacterium]